jgi:hypothetical protein
MEDAYLIFKKLINGNLRVSKKYSKYQSSVNLLRELQSACGKEKIKLDTECVTVGYKNACRKIGSTRSQLKFDVFEDAPL